MESLKAYASELFDMISSTSKTLVEETTTPKSQTPTIVNPPSNEKSVEEDQNQQTQEPTTLTPDEKSIDAQNQNAASDQLNVEEGKDGEDDEEEEGECGFCLFMKGGGCKESFTSWEKCVEEAEKNKENIVEKCHEVTSALKKCMEAHQDYYEPILRAEKALEEEAVIELEKEAAMKDESVGKEEVK